MAPPPRLLLPLPLHPPPLLHALLHHPLWPLPLHLLLLHLPPAPPYAPRPALRKHAQPLSPPPHPHLPLDSPSPIPSTYTHHFPSPDPHTHTPTPPLYTRTSALPPLTFPHPILTSDAYYNDDTAHRPTAYTVANRYAYPPHSPLPPSHSHSTHTAPRPTSAPSSYHPPTSPTTAYTRITPLILAPPSLPSSLTHLPHPHPHPSPPTPVQVHPRGIDVPSGYTRALGPPPAEGVGTEHAGLRVFSGQPGVREGQRVVEGRGGVGAVQSAHEWARLRRADPITAQWWQDGRGRYATSASHIRREEKEQLQPPLRAATAGGARPSIANGGVTHLYLSSSHRHFAHHSPSNAAATTSPSVQPSLDSGFTHNAHLIQPHPNHPLPTSHLHGRALPGTGLLTSHRLATDGVGSHADWVDPAGGVGGWEGRVDEDRVASAYAREERKEWGWGEEGRKVRHFKQRVDGGGVDWRTGREVRALDQMHPTVRRMGEVLQAEPFPTVKNYGAQLGKVDRDWVPQEQPLS